MFWKELSIEWSTMQSSLVDLNTFGLCLEIFVRLWKLIEFRKSSAGRMPAVQPNRSASNSGRYPVIPGSSAAEYSD